MVHRTPRLQPRHKTCTREDTRSSRHAIQTARSRQRRRRQYRRHTPPGTHIRQTGRRTRPQMDIHRRTSPTRTAKTIAAHERMARSLSTRIHKISHGTIHTPLETRRQNGIPTERRTQTRSPTSNTRQTNGSTRRTRLDDLHRQKSRLVARHVQMDRKLRQRVCQMSTKQNTHTPNHSPTVQNRCSPLSATIRSSGHGSDHSTP